MNKIFLIIICFFSFNMMITSQNTMLTYDDINGYYKIDYPENWEITDKDNQISFVSADDTMMAGVAYGDLKMILNAKDILNETLTILEVSNELDEQSSTATQQELDTWGADSANAAVFKMTQENLTFSYILIVMTKGTYYYSLMFVVNTNTGSDNDSILKTIAESFKILK